MYIWKNYSPDTRYEVAETPFSPYIEDFGEAAPVRQVNPLIRFSSIFNPLIQRGSSYSNSQSEKAEISETAEEKRREIENILFHYLAQLDRKCGIHADSLLEYVIGEALERGDYGRRAAELYCGLNPKYQAVLQHYLLCQFLENGRKLYYREAVCACFNRARLYYYEEDKQFLLYLPQAENEADRDLIELIGWLFLEMSSKVRVFWQYPFGIIGRSKTMIISNMQLY